MTGGSGEVLVEGALPEGTMLAGRYRLEAPIGAGGFGTVYRARQLPLGREVAVKVLPAHALLVPERIARFEHEAALFQRLEHPNTVRLVDFGIAEGGAPFIVMELLRGESLASLLEREGPQSEARTVRLARDVLKALMEAHSLGIVHRDIKPANIFITQHAGEPFFVKLLDFGIAKQTGGDALVSTVRPDQVAAGSPSLTGADQAMGTPRYMAPEQIFGEVVTPATDLYSLGLTLAEMLGGRPVFASENVAEILAMQASSELVPLSPVVSQSRLAGIVERATRKSAIERFSSSEEMLAHIDALGAPGVAESTSGAHVVGRPAAMAFAPTEATPAATRRDGRPAATSRWVLFIAVVGPLVAGALLLVGGYTAYSSVTPRAQPNRATSSATSSASSPAISSASSAASAAPQASGRATIMAKSEAQLSSILDADDWHSYQPPIRSANGDVVVVHRKGMCITTIVFGERPDEDHGRVYVENMSEHPSPMTYSAYDDRHILTITAAPFDPGANWQECMRDLRHQLVR